jgi:hypothetical protein
VRKKLVSIALALVLICGYSAKALSVDAYSDVNKFRTDVLNTNFSSGTPTNTNILSMDQMDKNLLIGKISSVMHYKAGQLVAIQERDGSISLYDSAGYRATLSETVEGSGVFEISNLSLRYTDINWKAVEDRGAGAWLGDYLASLGFEDTAFGSSGANGFGDLMGEKIISFIKEHGINSSFSFAPDSLGALTCTLNLDGKPQNTFNAYGDLTAEWIYNSNTGALEQSIVYSYKPAVGSDPAKWVATVTYYDGNGRESETYQSDVIDDAPGGAQPGRFPLTYHIDYTNQVLTTTYQYDKNGSKISEFDVKDNNYTYYGFGKPIAVVHVSTDTGHQTVKSKYIYYSGGTLKTIIEYNDNGEQSRVMVFSPKGKHLGTGTTQDPETLFKQLEEIDNMIKNLNATSQNDLLKYLYNNQISEVYLTAADIENPYVFMTFFLSEAEQAEVLAKWGTMKQSNPDATIQDAIRQIIKEADDAAKAKGQVKDESEAINAYRSVIQMYDVLSKSRSSFKITVESGQSTREKEDESRREQVYVDRKDEGKVEGRKHMLDHYSSGTGVDLGKGISSTTEVGTYDLATEESNNGQYAVDVETYGYFEEFIDSTLKFSITFTDYSKVPPVELSLSNQRTVGSEKTGETNRKISTETFYYDPAVIGEAQAFVDGDGNILTEDQAREMVANGQPVYIQLNPQSINMFDGAGFQDVVNPQEGEQIYVAVEDMDMFNAFKGAVGTGAQVMVTGVVTNDIDGRMTMHVYNTTNGAGIGFGLNSTDNKGYAVGDQVRAMQDEINKLSQQEGSWVYKNTQTNRGIFQAAGALDSSGYLRDWKDGWAALARLAGK